MGSYKLCRGGGVHVNSKLYGGVVSQRSFKILELHLVKSGWGEGKHGVRWNCERGAINNLKLWENHGVKRFQPNLLPLFFNSVILLTWNSIWGAGKAAMMELATSTLTFLNCCSCCLQTLARPDPSLPTLTLPLPSRWNANPVSKRSFLKIEGYNKH